MVGTDLVDRNPMPQRSPEAGDLRLHGDAEWLDEFGVVGVGVGIVDSSGGGVMGYGVTSQRSTKREHGLDTRPTPRF